MNLARITIYTNRTEQMIRFYEQNFGYSAFQLDGDRIVELTPPAGGTILMLHPLAKSRKEGQSIVKLGFDVSDIDAAHLDFANKGLKLGPIHRADNYGFANTKDPAGNSVSITDRAYRDR